MIHRARLSLPRRFRTLRYGLIGATGLLAVLAVAGTSLAVSYQRSIDEAGRYNRTFDAGQTALEIVRLQLSIAEAARDGVEPVKLRYAILRNRVGLIESGIFPVAEMRGELLPLLRNAVRELEPLIARLPEAAAISRAGAIVGPLIQPLVRMTSMAHAQAGDRIAENQVRLRHLLAGLCAMTMMLVLVGAALIAFVLRQNARLDHTVRRDALTGIANRLSFGARLGTLARTGERTVILVDVDHFKTLNDTHGHDIGDLVLTRVSQRLRAAAPDAAEIARIGGDEFALLYEGEEAGRRSRAACQRILARMGEPVLTDGREIAVGVTLGFASAAGDDEEGEAGLLKDADIALYEAKLAGRGRAVEFRPEMKHAFLYRRRLQEDLRGAIERGEMHLAFQPVVDLRTTRTRGFEALLRWRHPEFGAISPAEFIPLAEENAQILEIGRWVIAEAARAARPWPETVFVAVNVSTRQFADGGLVDHIRDVLAETGLAPNRFVVEITETVLIDNDEAALRTMGVLRALGCRVSLDDFGTGYSSLGYLSRFPFDKLKIDRSFLANGRIGENGLAIISTMCTLARRLRLDVVAEGIETEEQRLLVSRAGCGLGQGYLFGRPESAADALLRLQREEVDDRLALRAGGGTVRPVPAALSA
ncbi:putative bifunctional diguanylate cyclase/phosphodiesterase [Aureimonas jatrophae]|uniref:Diguanylate cyclase (GGDEF) domain-containing protein n=1 Tax=Aureimonas jatrophae TaxID=1166073 RepID=A0A1H0HWF6_9HYPH|nr:bifunctional diguanylate cyclase/phosphodiesterase [Aureimonas jatrophae]MBB3950814.1 diguanylate cyclase (GGDEF)-like protein [Aureimonas jatrophae]SDO23538.1 diguanylate cyclase (GGDEF) domain-containing protein [Aureimonas jatrophae]